MLIVLITAVYMPIILVVKIYNLNSSFKYRHIIVSILCFAGFSTMLIIVFNILTS
jgi:chemotaxis protein CheY-P-specific phosphatase CheC